MCFRVTDTNSHTIPFTTCLHAGHTHNHTQSNWRGHKKCCRLMRSKHPSWLLSKSQMSCLLPPFLTSSSHRSLISCLSSFYLQTSARFLCFHECFLWEFSALTVTSSGSPDQRCGKHRAVSRACMCVCTLIQRQHWSVWAKKRLERASADDISLCKFFIVSFN